MFNNFNVIGRFKNYYESKDNKTIVSLILTNDINGSIILPFIVSKNMIDKMKDYMKENDLVGIKGNISISKQSIKLIATNVISLSDKNK